MTVKKAITNFILENPEATNEQVAIAVDTTSGTVCKTRSDLRSEGILEKFDPKSRRKPAEVKNEIELPEQPEINNLPKKIKDLFKKSGVYSIDQLSDMFDVGVTKVKKCIGDLIEAGYNFTVKDSNVIFSTLIPKSEETAVHVAKLATGFYKFGACGDNHLCSRYERLNVLNKLYDYYQQEGVTIVYNTGNWIDGEARFNKHDLHTHGLDAQINYFIKEYPQRKGITTYFIAGDDHEGWYVQDKGIDIGRYAEMKARQAGRNDLVYLGYMEADVILKAPQGQTKLRILHPGGGSSYAVSYTSQKIVESYQGGEKPDVLFIGHYHKAEYLYIRGVHTVQTGTTMDQSPFMRKKRLAAHLGGWIVEIGTDERGAVTRFKPEFFPFFDNAYYEKWDYKW